MDSKNALFFKASRNAPKGPCGRCSPTGSAWGILVSLFGRHCNVFMTDWHIFQHGFGSIFCQRQTVSWTHLLESIRSKHTFQKGFVICAPRSGEIKCDEGWWWRKIGHYTFCEPQSSTQLKRMLEVWLECMLIIYNDTWSLFVSTALLWDFDLFLCK